MRRPSRLYPSACCKLLLALALKALAGLLLLWRTMWFALLCYKLAWEGAFHRLQQVCSTMTLWLEVPGDPQEEDSLSSPPGGLWLQGAGATTLEQEVQRLQESSSSALRRLEELESSMQHLSQDLRCEKLLWSSRYLELLREQQGLLVQLQRQDQVSRWQDADGPSESCGGTAGWRPWSPEAEGTDGERDSGVEQRRRSASSSR